MTDAEENYQRNLARIARLRLMDDNFLSICMADNVEGAQLMSRIIIGNDNIHVQRVETQKQYTSLTEHSFCFDVYAVDEQGNNIEIEVQRKNAGAIPERAACHSGVLDANSMPKNDEDYHHKAETFTIFITEHDVLRGNFPIYHIDRSIREMNHQPFGDKSHIIYVNGAYREDETSPLGRLVHDLFCTEPDDMYYQELANRVRYFKKDSKGVNAMCEIWEEVRREGLEQGISQGIEQGISQGIKQGISQGIEQGISQGERKTELSSIRNLMETLHLTAQQAMDALKIPVEKRKSYVEQL